MIHFECKHGSDQSSPQRSDPSSPTAAAHRGEPRHVVPCPAEERPRTGTAHGGGLEAHCGEA